MVELLQMWALVEVLGLLCLPLTITVFHNLPDRGWFIAGVLLILTAFSMIGFIRVRRDLAKLVSANIFYIAVCEAIFLGMVFLLGWIRSYGPDIHSFEMFMDEGFLAAIMRSPHFPPNDMWLSGYPINYYYYAHFTIATLAKLLGQSPSIAFNTGICIFFGLTAVNLFGVSCNIVSWARHLRSRNTMSSFSRERQSTAVTQNNEVGSDRPDKVFPPLAGAIPYGLFTMIMGQVLGNLASTQQWWKLHDDLPPLYWFDASRVIDKTINEFPAFSFLLSCFHAHVLTLAFTILALGLAFNLFLEHGGDGRGRGLRVFGSGWRLPFTMGTTALILGGLFTMNGWDFPTDLTITVICIALQQWLAYRSRFSLELVLDVFTAGASLAALSFFLYAPFYLNFVSPLQGIGLVSPGDRSPISDEALIYGMFVFIFVSLVFANLLRPRLSAQAVAIKNSLAASSNGLSKLAGTFKQDPAYRDSTEDMSVSHGDVQIGSGSLSTASGPYLATPVRQRLLHQPGDIDTTTSMVEATTDQSLADSSPSGIQPTVHTRSSRTGWLDIRLISLVLIIGVALLAFAILKNGLTFAVAFTIAALGAALALYHIHDRPRAFTLLLGALAFGLVAMTEIIFLKDVFAASYPRMNTVFKFYFQAWALLSIASGAGLYFILDGFRPAATVAGMRRWVRHGGRALWSVMLALFILAGLVYPVVGSYQRTNQFMQRTNSLDGLNYMQSYDPGDYYAIRWLNSHIQGDPVIVEAYGPQGGDYSDYGRISAFTGLPTLMGWAGHEYQWRVNWLNKDSNAADFYRRGSDINSIYTDTHPDMVLELMAHYNAQYLYVGPLEQMTYTGANLQRFKSFMKIIYAADGVTIYRVP